MPRDLLPSRLTGVNFLITALMATLMVLPYVHGNWRLADDAYLSMLPNHLLQERIFRGGEWPLWNLNVGLGQPWAVGGSSSLYYPMQVLWGLIIGWSEASYVWYMWAHLILGGMLAATFGRRAGLSQPAAWFFALAFESNGYLLGMFSTPSMFTPFLWWPLLGTSLINLHRKDASRAAAILSLALGLFMIETAGYPVTKILIFLATFVLYWGWVRRDGSFFGGVRVKEIASAGMIAVLVSAPEWISTLKVLSLTDRFNSNIYDQLTFGNPTNFISLATFLLPVSFLMRDVHQLGMVWLERSWWIGSLPLLLALFALSRYVVKPPRFWIASLIAGVAFLYSMGGHSFVREIFGIAGPLAHLRHSNNARCITMAFIAFAGALGFDGLTALLKKQKQLLQEKFVPLMGPWIAFFVAAAAFAITEGANRVHARDVPQADGMGWKVDLLHTAFYLLLAWTALVKRRSLTGRFDWQHAWVAIHFLILADAAYGFRFLVAVRANPPVAGRESFEIASPQPNSRSLKAWFDGKDWTDYGGNLKVLNAYNPPYHRHLEEAKNHPKTKALIGQLVSCRADLRETFGSEIPGTGPVSCDGMEMRIDRYFGNTIEISGRGAAAAALVVHDLHDPGWKATLDGQSVPVLKALDYFKGVMIPGGRPWKVVFRYEDPMLTFMFALSALGLLGGCVVARAKW